MKNLKLFLLIFILFQTSSCGKKGGIEYVDGQKKPNFERVFD
jgi:predicted small lipoprotein YifL